MLTGNAIALGTIHQMKLEHHRTVFFVFVAGLAWADLIGIIINTVPVLVVYTRGHFIAGVSALISFNAPNGTSNFVHSLMNPITKLN